MNGYSSSLALLLLTAWVGMAPVGQLPATAVIPPQVGVASGTVQAGKLNVTLRHAYASGPIDSGGTVYQIVLTDSPIPPEALSKELERGGQQLLKTGKLSGIALLVDDTGFIRNMVPFIGELRGSRMLASAGQLQAFRVTPPHVTGQGRATPEQTSGQGWSYAASWNAALEKPRR